MPATTTTGRLTPERLTEIRARLEAATPRPWAWFGNTRSRQIYLATQRWGRHFVMQFDRWGMQGGQPRFRNWGDERHGARPAGGVMESLSEMGAPVDHNHDLVDVPHPDAALIANAPTYLDEVLPELDAAAHELDLLAETARRLTEERDAARAANARMEDAIRWVDGEVGEWPGERPEGRGPYFWRAEMMQRAGLRHHGGLI